jgi:STE24 endopeptidase
MSQILFYIIVGLIVADFIFERILEYLNSTQWSNQLPEEVKGIYDEEKYHQQQAYEKVNFRFSLITSSFSFLVILLMFLLAGFAWVNGLA